MRFMALMNPRYQKRVIGPLKSPNSTVPSHGRVILCRVRPAAMGRVTTTICPSSFFSACRPKRSSRTPSTRVPKPARPSAKKACALKGRSTKKANDQDAITTAA